MKRKINTVLAACAVALALVIAEPAPAAASHEESHHQKQRQTARRVRHKTKAKKSRRRAVSFVCPMHPDIREKSRGTCPKCLMDLVAEPRNTKRATGEKASAQVDNP